MTDSLKKWLLRIWAVLFGLLLAMIIAVAISWFFARPAVVKAVVFDSPQAHIGEPVEYLVEIESPWARWPLGALDIRAPADFDVAFSDAPELTGIGAGTFVWTYRLGMQAFAVGEVDSLSGTAEFTAARAEKNGYSLNLQLPGFKVEPRLEPGAPSDVGGLISAPEIPIVFNKKNDGWFYLVALSLLVLIVIVIALTVFFKKGEDDDGVEQESPAEFRERMLAALQELERELPMPADVFFVRVTDILRTYIERCFVMPANEMTTPEFLRHVRDRELFESDQRDRLINVLEFADQVKFGRSAAEEERMRETLAQAVEFVINTADEHDDF